MATCSFDNPATMRREFWRDGHLHSSHAFELLFIKHPPKHLVGARPCKSGQIVGDKSALTLAKDSHEVYRATIAAAQGN